MLKSLTRALILLLVCAPVWGLGAQEAAVRAHYVIEIVGNAQIHRAAWSDPSALVALALGDRVTDADLIFPEVGGEVVILCSSGEITFIAGTSSSPSCGELPSEAVTMYERPRAGGSRPVVELITPRGQLLSGTPRFHWTQVGGAASYALVIRESGTGALVWRQLGLTGGTFDYPSDQDPLEAGEYTVSIEGRNENNTPITQPYDVSIVVAARRESENVRESAQARIANGIPRDWVTFFEALYYAQNKYFSDALMTADPLLDIDLAEAVIEPGFIASANGLRSSPQLYLHVGSWYANLELNDLAVRAYRSALQLAKDQNYQENEAEARRLLAEAEPDARTHYCLLAPALEFYLRVGQNDAIVTDIQLKMNNDVSLLQYTPTCI